MIHTACQKARLVIPLEGVNEVGVGSATDPFRRGVQMYNGDWRIRAWKQRQPSDMFVHWLIDFHAVTVVDKQSMTSLLVSRLFRTKKRRGLVL